MAINNPLTVINSLTDSLTKANNDIDDLKRTLKDSSEKNAALLIDKNQHIKNLEYQLATQDAIPKDEPLINQLERQAERADKRIADLEEQLSAERCAAGYLRSYIIESLQSANSAALLAQYVVDKAKASNNVKPMRFKGGFLALEPIARGVGDGIMRKYLQDAMEELKSIQPTNIKVK